MCDLQELSILNLLHEVEMSLTWRSLTENSLKGSHHVVQWALNIFVRFLVRSNGGNSLKDGFDSSPRYTMKFIP